MFSYKTNVRPILRGTVATAFISFMLVLFVIAILLWRLFANPQQSTVRLDSKMTLNQLSIAIDSYKKFYGKYPKDFNELKAVGLITDISHFRQFEYVAGLKNILAFQKFPFRKTEKGEPWGGNGNIAIHDIPASRFILFNDGSIRLIDESNFNEKYGLLEDKNNVSNNIDSVRNSNTEFEELIPGMNWSRWYFEMSGYQPDPNHFGAYVTLPIERDLYIGLSTGLPSLGDGALILRVDDKDIEYIGSLHEEGVHEMIWDDKLGIIHIAGTDPSWPNDWSAGNHYNYVPSGPKNINKYRDPVDGLVNVIHTWGLWISEDHVLYAAVNSHDGTFTRDRNVLRKIYYRINFFFNESYYSSGYGTTRMGQVLKSINNGKSWRHISNLGYFRAYDIIGLNNNLYAIYNDLPQSPCKLATSNDGGKSWRDVTQSHVQKTHMLQFQNKILAVSIKGKSIYATNTASLIEYDLPEGFKIVPHYRFNILAEANGYLYAICLGKDGYYSILRTSDLLSWERIARINKELISLSYWKKRNCLVVSSKGIQAKLWKLDLQ